MAYYPATTFCKNYYRKAIQSFDPISIELLPNWLWRVEDLEMKYKEQYYSYDILTCGDEWVEKNKKAWTQFKKTREDFLIWFNGLLETHGYDRFLNEDNYWKLHRIVEFKHEH